MSVNLSIVPRDHFYRDPMFKDCWNAMQEERQAEVRRSFYNDNPGGGKNVEVPWKWDKMGKIKELFNEPPNIQKSCEVDTTRWFYKILLDVQQFEPEDLTITLTNRTINLKGCHNEKNDSLGAVSRFFTRNFTLPVDAVMEKLACHISLDGVLHIIAPRSGHPISNGHHHSNGDKEFDDTVKHTFPSPAAVLLDGNRNTTISDVSDRASVQDIDGCSIRTIPDFDMVPFWAREDKSNAESKFGVKSDLENFKVLIDVSQFSPEEVSVYSTRHYVTIEGKHLEKEDAHGFISRNFTRKYWMPAGVSAKDLTCQMTSNGVLEIMAPMPKHHTDESLKIVRLPIVLIEEAKVQKWVDPQLV